MDQELITLGIGNYGVLAAAHWANGTTRYDLEHNTVYRERRGGASPAVRLLLLDQAQPSRVKRMLAAPGDGAEEMANVPTQVDMVEDGAEGEEAEAEDFVQWSWETNRRHTYVDPHQEGNAGGEGRRNNVEVEEAADDEDNDEDETAFAKELNAPPRLSVVPWWRHITVPTDRDALLTSAYFSDPLGGLLAHSFGFGRRQRFDGASTAASSSSTEHMSGLDVYFDRVRRELERADHVQGLQLFADGDSAFGGVACSLLEQLKDDYEDVRATVAHTAFPVVADGSGQTDFAKRRSQEVILNRALATVHLAETSALYTPYENRGWTFGAKRGDTTSEAASPSLPGFDTDDDVACAAIMAAAADSVLYPCRVDPSSASDEGGRQSLAALVDTLRPAPSLRVTSASVALPLLVPTVAQPAFRRPGATVSQPSLWSVLTGSPLMDATRWVPLTHAFPAEGAEACQTDAGRVVAHSTVLRGVAGLTDVEYPRTEALLRYCFPLRTSRCRCTLFDEPYPVAGSFPLSRLLNAPAGEKVETIRLGASVTNTFQSAAYLRGVVAAAEPVMRHAKHTHGSAYGMEDDEWRDVAETLHALRDAYDHEGGVDDDVNDEGED